MFRGLFNIEAQFDERALRAQLSEIHEYLRVGFQQQVDAGLRARQAATDLQAQIDAEFIATRRADMPQTNRAGE